MTKQMNFWLLILLPGFFAACNLEKVEPNNGNASKFNTTVGGNAHDSPRDIIVAPNGGYVIVGVTQSFGNANQSYIVKLNNEGGQEWEKDFGGAQDDEARAVTASADGGFVFCGKTRDINLVDDIQIVKVNAQGGKVWEKTYGSVDSNEVAFGIVPVGASDFMVAYQVTGSVDIIRLLRINTNGGKVSEKTVKTGDLDLVKMIKTSDGKLVLSGSLYGTATASYALKLNEDGSLVWENSFPNPATNFTPSYGVVELADKSIVLAGSDLGPNTSDHDFNLVAFNEIGGKLWDEGFGGASADELVDVTRSTDNELVVTGYTGSFSVSNELYLSKRKASDGTKIWEKHYFSIAGNVGAIAACSDGGVIVCAAQNQSNSDIIVVKTDKDGNYE